MTITEEVKSKIRAHLTKMGEMLIDDLESSEAVKGAFKFVQSPPFDGVILEVRCERVP